ncbi:MAG: type II toxin-antitoxin system VapC family toxin [Planctomycetes bacterium]|nr:type II toxin-antitoxin system VapC family toxin [Planctomycetota bacterium]
MNFWDSSAVIEAHDSSSELKPRFENLLRQRTRHAASRLILPEVVSGLTRRNTDAARRGKVVQEVLEVLDYFLLHAVTDARLDEAVELVRRDGLRGCDAVHLATALAVARETGRKGFVFVTRDKEQAAAARKRGLRVLGT